MYAGQKALHHPLSDDFDAAEAGDLGRIEKI